MLAISLTDNDSQTSDGKIYLDEIDLDNAELSLDGQLELMLPLYYPFASDFKGNLTLSIGDLGDIENTTSLTLPEISEEEQQGEPTGLLDRLWSILNGLDTWFQIAIDAFNGKVAGVELPFVGKDLGKVADFLEKVRDDVISEITDRFKETEGDTAAALQIRAVPCLRPRWLEHPEGPERQQHGDAGRCCTTWPAILIRTRRSIRSSSSWTWDRT